MSLRIEDPVRECRVYILKAIIVPSCIVIRGGSGAQQNAVRDVIFGFAPDPARKHTDSCPFLNKINPMCNG